MSGKQMTMTIRVWAVVVAACAGLQAQPSELTILYTGKLLGYARTPDIQRVQQWGWRVDGTPREATQQVKERCESGKAVCQRLYEPQPGSASSCVANVLTKVIRRESNGAGPGRLLLGMGDNFAMDYFSRVVLATMYGGEEEYIAKDELYYDAPSKKWVDLRDPQNPQSFEPIREDELSGKTEILEDNVATFFAATGYDALVPGKHDFFYGPERLRQLARLLAAKGGTQMLAANLILRSTLAHRPVEVDQHLRAKKRNFETRVGEMKWSLPKTVLPWIRTFRLKNYRDSSRASLVKPLVEPGVRAELCQTSDRDEKPVLCKALSSGREDPKRPGDLVYRVPGNEPVEPERTYLLCARLLSPKDKNKKDICEPVDVSTPFFQYRDPGEDPYAKNQEIKQYPNLQGTGVQKWVKKQGAIVMGVVAPGLESLVGSLNASYINVNKKYDTYAVAIDPVEALTQLLEFCKAIRDCAANTPLVLMAQMPRDEAAILNSRMNPRFAVVLAQADSRFSTANEKVDYSAGHRPVVLVPRELIEKDEQGKNTKGVQLHVAKLTGLATPMKVALTTSAPPRVEIRVDGLTAVDCLSELVTAAWTAATREGDTKNPHPASWFRPVVLHALRDALHADVALMQERDFFDVEGRVTRCQATPISSLRERIRASIEQIIWKGDFAISRTITGAALKSALKESERLRTLEENSYRVYSESGRWLHYLGVLQDPETKTWYVNGGAVDDKTTYTVAMTDFLAYGDTGYTDLQDPAVSPKPRPRELGRLRRLSDAVMVKLDTRFVLPTLNAPAYLDYSNHAAFPLPARAGFLKQVLAIRHALLEKHPKLDSSADRLGQTRPYWRLLVDKGEVGFTDYRHNKTTHDQLNAQFAGTSESGVLARKTGTFPLGLQVEARRERTRHHYFSRTEIDYMRTKAQQEGSAGRFLTTYPSNKVSIESGYRSTFRGTMRSRPWTGFLLSAYGGSNLHRPVVDGLTAGVTGCTAEASTPCPAKVAFASDLSRTNRLLAKLGIRREYEQNWVETGFFGGAVFRPAEFAVLQNNVPVPVVGSAGVCRLADLVSAGNPVKLNDCLRTAFAVVVSTPKAADAVSQTLSLRGRPGSKLETGMFLNFNYRVPVPKNWVVKDLYFEQRGSWFFNHPRDSVVDARLNEKFSFGPTLTVIPNMPGLSLKPTYTLFFYESKIVRNLLAGRTIDITLNYRFDWKTGASWKQVLRYGRPK